ncbi:isoprenoid synthase domain-containing protein [Xylogone sp. PMI_703]|nr:isoprenoid synthase domain-containing protein [Xylogone sp. PMI_703]
MREWLFFPKACHSFVRRLSSPLFTYESPPSCNTISPCSTQQFENIVNKLLRDIAFKPPPVSEWEVNLPPLVIEHFKGLELPSELSAKTYKMAKWVSIGVVRSYPFAEEEVLVSIGIFTTYLFIIDDFGKDFTNDLENFQARLLSGEPQPNLILKSFLEFMPTMRTLYGRFACDMMLKATIEFIGGCLLENQYDGHIEPPRTAPTFASYFRLKTGYAEPYAHFLFPEAKYPEASHLQEYLPIIPDLLNFINYSNDVLSFYKESIVANERFNYIYNYSRTHDVDIHQSLERTCKEVVESVRNIRATLSSTNSQMLEDVEQFLQGFIAYHVYEYRYRMSELRIIY